MAEATVAAVRDALTRSLEADAPGEELRVALRAMAQDARAQGLRAEHILVALKEIWAALPQVRGASREHRTTLLQRAVTLCINEYYAP